MSDTQHTPGPWSWYQADGAKTTYTTPDPPVLRPQIRAAEGPVASVYVGKLTLGINISEERARANAEHIVRCVNAHDDLLAACEHLVELIRGNWGDQETHLEREMAKAIAAIAQAKGE